MKVAIRMVLMLSPLVVVLCCAHPAAAQTNVCIARLQYCGLCGDTPIPGMQCTPEAPFLSQCIVQVDSCSPRNAASETGCPGCFTAGHPINLTDGNTSITQSDFRLPGLGGGLGLSRTWLSKWPPSQIAFQTGLFGPNWRSSYEERLFVGSDNYFKYSRSDGSFWSFAYDGSTGALGVAAPAEESILLVSSGSIWTMTFKNGTKKIFDYNSGWLKSIVDRNGNTTNLTYDANNRLIAVTDPAARTLTFNYPDSNSRLVSSVVSNAGTFTYAYDAQGRLVQVTRPDNTFVTFEYDANSLITAVKDTDGKVLEAHTYDTQARGLTSTRANGVDAVTMSYPPDPSSLNIVNPH